MSLPDHDITARITERLGIADIELQWGQSAGGLSDALSRRELALGRARDTKQGVRATRVAHRALAPMGRPRKLSRHDELEIAIFLATRRLQRRLVKNAISDAMRRFKVCRASITHADQKHRAEAAFIAFAFRHNGKTFRKIVTLAKRVNVPSFRDWSPDER